MLRTLGHEVLEAPDAPTALDMLASNSVDTLLTDVGLPRVSGTVLARQARERSSNLRIIIATGDAGAAQVAQEIGATYCRNRTNRPIWSGCWIKAGNSILRWTHKTSRHRSGFLVSV